MELSVLTDRRGRGLEQLQRAFVTTGVLARTSGRTARRLRSDPDRARLAARELRAAFAELGPTYVKLAQLIASTPGLFPDVLSAEMRSLLDAAPGIPYAGVREVVEAELGAAPEELYRDFDPTPLASASIAQVHAAALPAGERVVVKVQRPGIRPHVVADVRILHRVARALERLPLGDLANPVGVVEDFATTLAGELNFVTEARAMEQVAANLRAGGHDGVRVPGVHWALTSPRVLTMERVDGWPIDHPHAWAAAGVDALELIRRGVYAWLESVLQHGLFHGDVHAGNLMVDTDGRLVLLDFGITGRLDERTRRLLQEYMLALLVLRDFPAVVRCIAEMGAVPPDADLDATARDIERAIGSILDRPLAEISYGEVLVAILRVNVRHRIRLPREHVLVAKQLFYFERYAKLLAPEWNIFSDPQLLEVIAAIAAPAA